MTKKEWFGFAVILAVCAFFCGLYWFFSEGRFANAREFPVATAMPVASAAPLLAPQNVTSAIVTSVSSPVEINAFIPDTIESIKYMPSTKGTRVTLEIPEADADKLKVLERRGQYVLSVRRVK